MLKTEVIKRSANRISKFKRRTKRRVIERTVINKKPMPLVEYTDHGHWHRRKSITIKGRVLTFAGLVTGCGLGQVHGVTNLGSDVTRQELLTAFSDIKSDGVGAVLCTLGQDYYHHEETLFKLGFEKMSEYPNYRHGQSGSYRQRMYLLKL